MQQALHASTPGKPTKGQQGTERWNTSTKLITCPQLISLYNTYMGGVDKNDKMKSYYTIPVSGKKWWSTSLFDLVDMSIFNSFNALKKLYEYLLGLGALQTQMYPCISHTLYFWL